MDRVIIHDGSKGMHWHIRRWRGYDGKLTEEGRKRYDYYENKTDRVYNTARQKQLMANKPYVKSNKWGTQVEDLSRFTTQELKALTERAEAENNYRKVYNTYRNTGLRQFVESAKNFAKDASSALDTVAKVMNSVNNIKQQMKRSKDLDKGKYGQKIKDRSYDKNKPRNNAPKLGGKSK